MKSLFLLAALSAVSQHVNSYEYLTCSSQPACGVVAGATAMTSSGYWKNNDEEQYHPREARLDNIKYWHRREGDPSPWLQVDLGSVKKVTGFVTQGRPTADINDWITEIKIQYGNDESNLNCLSYNGQDIIFQGNTDRNSHKVNMSFPINARYVRFVCVSWSREAALRVEVLGCA